MRRALQSSWLYYGLAATLALVAVATQIDLKWPSRPEGDRGDLRALRERDDVNVLFVMVDTLRADRLGAWGYERDTSPHLDRLAASGIRFAHTEAQSSWTKTSMASLWTATYPHSNEILRHPDAVPEDARMAAEVFREAGFRTGGIFRNGWVDANFGFSQGFDLYVRPETSQSPDRAAPESPGTRRLAGSDWDVTESALQFLRTHQERRFFLYLHYMDVHQYVYETDSAKFGTGYSDMYDNAIHWTDRNLRALTRELEELGLSDETLLVVASDHGEAFYEHGREGHAKDLYREVTEVPWAIVPPFRLESGIVVEETVENVDIWPTVLDLLGLPPLPAAQGRSRVPRLLGEGEAEEPGPSFSQLDRTWGRVGAEPDPIVAVVEDPHRLVYKLCEPEALELYDHRSDPAEATNVADEQREVARALRTQAERYLSLEPARWGAQPGHVELDEMRLQMLRALGYAVGGGRQDRGKTRTGCPEAAQDGGGAASETSAPAAG